MIFFQYFLPLVGSFISGMGAVVTMCVAVGILCACPYVVRGIIDHV